MANAPPSLSYRLDSGICWHLL